MTTDSTEIGLPGRGFPETSWTLVVSAKGEGAQAKASLDRLLELYWKPIYWSIRTRWHKSNEDAKDLTQEFFATVLDKKTLADMREQGARFRTFLRGCLENFLLRQNRDRGRQKRGGGARHLPIGTGECEIDVPATGLSAEEAFDQAWSQTILRDAMAALAEHYRSSGRELYWRIFERYHLAPEPATYEALATELGIKTDDVQNRLRHARRKLDELVRERVRETLSDPERDLEDELRILTGRPPGAKNRTTPAKGRGRCG